MEARNPIAEIREVVINPANHHSGKVTFNDLCLVKDVKATDIVVGIENIHGCQEPGFGSMDNEQVYVNYWVLRIQETRYENDEEYGKRMREMEIRRQENEKREWNEYVRLTAKYGGDCTNLKRPEDAVK
jgi:hypothetical protein